MSAERMSEVTHASFRQLPTAYIVLAPDLTILDANDAYCAMLQRPREAFVGRQVFEAFPPSRESLDEQGRNPVEVSLLRARATGRPDPMVLTRYDVQHPGTGELEVRYWSTLWSPVLDERGEVLALLQRVEDATDFVRTHGEDGIPAAEWKQRAVDIEASLYASTRELQQVVGAAEVMARRLTALNVVALELTAAESVDDLEQIIVARGLSVLGADGGAIISRHEDGGWRATLSSLGGNVVVDYGHMPYDSPLPAPEVARTGRRILLPTRAAGLAFDDSMAAVYVDTGRLGWAFLPLTVNDRSVGSLAVAWQDEHPIAADELALLEGFAAQCAQALERIRVTTEQLRLAQEARHFSEALQRSLLTSPPTPDHLTIAVRYQPASQQAQVGGDWYDAFVTARGDTLLVVGDVTGHDRTAAAAMGQLRNLLRGLAYDSADGPAALLSRLDRALRGLEVETLATAVLVRVEQDAPDRPWRLRWSSAGHLPPLLRRPDGTVAVLESDPDLLLGVDPLAGRSEQTVEVEAGSALLLCTDGLVEKRHESLDEGIARLVATFAAHGDLTPEHLCDAVLYEVRAGGNVDDIALLAMRVGAPS